MTKKLIQEHDSFVADYQGESDPNGVSQHEPGAKLDAGKTRVALMMQGFAKALESVSEVSTYGASKYTDHGWRSVPNGIERYQDAMMRHYLAHLQGEEFDTGSGSAHLAHVAWNALAILELYSSVDRTDKEQDGLLSNIG